MGVVWAEIASISTTFMHVVDISVHQMGPSWDERIHASIIVVFVVP